MSLDNIQAVEAEEVVKRDERLSTNSIRFKPESLAKAKERVKSLEVSRDQAVRLNEHIVEKAVEEGKTDEEIKEKTLDSAVLIARLENEINILKTGESETAELIDTRAIRLIDKMIKAARTNSKGIYEELAKEDEVTDADTFSENEVAEDKIDVEKISKENEEPVKESIETAIEEKSLNEDEISDIFDVALGINGEEPKTSAITIDADELEQKINENVNKKLEEFQASEEKEETEEVVKEEPAGVKAFNFKNMFAGVSRPIVVPVSEENIDAIRDIPEVVPERVETAEEKEEIEEYTTTDEEEVVVEPKSFVISAETKDKLKGCTLEELTKILDTEDETTTELEKEVNSVEENVKGVKEVNAQVIAEEAAAEQQLADLDAEAVKAEEQLKDMMIERAYAKQSKNNDRRTYIQTKIDEMDDINKDTGSRLENLERLDKESLNKKEQLAMLKEMMLKYGAPEEEAKEKTK